MASSLQTAGFRAYIPSQDEPRSKELASSDAYDWAFARCNESFIANWTQRWEKLVNEPYKGISVDGNVTPGVHRVANNGEDLGAPAAEMIRAAQAVLDLASSDQKKVLQRSIGSVDWRRWMNPEIYLYRHGLRLEDVSDEIVEAIHGVMKASLSPAGYAKAKGCLKTNQFLGEVVNGSKVLNEKSYNFTIFGTPSHEPWGWQLHGHHFCMNCLVVGTQMVISPVFMGAEPNIIDEGPDKGTELFTDQEQLALRLMSSLDEATQKEVRIYPGLGAEDMPSWRFHRADQRHLGGAFQDNRIVPYEGVRISTFSAQQQDMVRDLIVLSLNYLPAKALDVRMLEISSYWKETYFCWIGKSAQGEAFYYKIHSPVVMVEFDHHTGVFLSNKIPLPFHIHTLVRTPNGNDYGKELIKQYYK
ncbi:hypothetical protein NW767_015400 [Fusarium falciforme]|uniref:DUF3500 domain-containing protein n=1 Tax=Fusarium falciforme TaxID=195108 RepID=A0A9W8QST7_9HYPO|nr:hypothetical protein NW759_017530 [Fusarium solani]KAJ4176581.1 hypothetical protein NW767_015400 [Fusarium falciforme]KAJ4177127.1 hypothetical protein NW755_014029 [Fusarium falciforme]KAJ4231859.1 hypothetical protein NW757_013863 [Fusarium falciforme]